MLSHALCIVVNELRSHLDTVYGTADGVAVGNIAEGVGTGTGLVPRGVLNVGIVNLKEEKALKNLPAYVRHPSTSTVTYENPPTFLNFYVLITATHSTYTDALLMLSRALRFFQSQNVFTQSSVAPASLTANAPTNVLDQLDTFKIVFDLYSPSMEEVNHLWGTLGGKQYPFAMYVMRVLDLKFRAVRDTGPLITEIVSDFAHKNGVAP